MKHLRTIALTVAASMVGFVGFAHATSFGTNITVNDGVPVSGTGWYGAQEDNEVEPGMQQGQKWDLEGFFLDGNNLSIVGGYNFYTGVDGMRAGDIFIDLNGDAVYSPNSPAAGPGPGNTISNHYYNFDYVLDINWAAGTYDVVKLDANSVLLTGIYGTSYNWPSNPWQYQGDGVGDFTFTTYGMNPVAGTGFQGDSTNNVHYAATFSNLSFLTGTAVFHNTMECGNDNLIGKTAVPEPSSLLLLGCGLLGLAALNRRKNRA